MTLFCSVSNPFIPIISHILPEPHAGLLNGILFGVKSSIPPDLYQALITSGTIHIVALSGQNISILVRIVSEATLFGGRKFSIIATFLLIFGFLVLVGREPTIIRAAIMGCLSLLAVYFGKKEWSLLSLILAASTMLIYNPDWIDDISFQLSFLATLGIIVLAGKIEVQAKGLINEIIRETKINLKTTLAAQIFTLPLIFIYFKRISLVAPLSNILIGWTITPIMTIGIFMILVSLIWLPLGAILGWANWALISYLMFIIKITAAIPFASLQI